MIVPQMQQRYTGYSSEGSGNLLDAVMRKRSQDLNYKARMAEADARERQFQYAIERDKKLDKDQELDREANKQLAEGLKTMKKTQENYEEFKRNEDAFVDSQTSFKNVSFMNLLGNMTFPGMLSNVGRQALYNFGYGSDPTPDALSLSEYMYNNIIKSDEDIRREFSDITGGAPSIYEPVYNPRANDPALRQQYFNQFGGSGYTFGNQPKITIK